MKINGLLQATGLFRDDLCLVEIPLFPYILMHLLTLNHELKIARFIGFQ